MNRLGFAAFAACVLLLACSPSGGPVAGDPGDAAPGQALAAAPQSPASQPPAMQPIPEANWDVDLGASRIGFSGTHAGNAFSGRFERFNVSVRFDSADLANAKARVVIDTGSARTGDKLQESTLKESDWFDVAKSPIALFESDGFSQTGPDQFEMRGQLTIKGTPTPVRLPFQLTKSPASATVKGRVELDRIALKIGVANDAKAEWVSAKIPLDITLVANARPAAGQ